MTFFRFATSENHHDFSLMELSPHARSSPDRNAIGLAHVAFKIGRSAEELRQARRVFDASGTKVLDEAARAFAKSVHVLDPDGNEVELYIESLGLSEG
jgi:catechol-2,3-dioxygenase